MVIRIGILVLLLVGVGARSAGFDHSHTNLTMVLQKHVRDGLVSYRALKADRRGLDRFLSATSKVKGTEFDHWTENQQVAYLINVYNSRTLELILDHYPLKSIKKIGWLPGAAWRKKFVPLFGKTISLGHIEHEILRKRYNLPEIHFALVCAAKGCPPLRADAYTAVSLREQLAEQGRHFLQNTPKNRVLSSKKRLLLSPIFDWFESDFEKKSGSVTAFVKLYLPPADAALVTDAYRITYTDYDWSLNDRL
ncbi:MAG: DUF547 domain-containing protein [Limisphaerales bacterium]